MNDSIENVRRQDPEKVKISAQGEKNRTKTGEGHERLGLENLP